MSGYDATWLVEAARNRGIELHPPAQSPLESLSSKTFETPGDSITAKDALEDQRKRRKVNRAPSKSMKILQKVSTINRDFTSEDYEIAITELVGIGARAGVLERLLRDFWQDTVQHAKVKLSEKREKISNDHKYTLVNSLLETVIRDEKYKSDRSWVDILSVLTARITKENVNSHLKLAIQKRDFILTKLFLQRDGDPNTCKQEILNTIQQGCFELVQLLGQSPVPLQEDVLAKGLILSLSHQTTQVLQVLLASGANVNRGPPFALECAINMQSLDAILRMLGGTCLPTSETLDQAVGYLYTRAKLNDEVRRYEILEALLHGGATGDNTAKALVSAVMKNDLSACGLLVKKGASVTYNRGEAFTYALQKWRLEALQLLKKQGLGPKRATLAFTTFMKCKDTMDPDPGLRVLQIVLEEGAKGEQIDDALIGAVDESNEATTKLLLEYHASVNHLSAKALKSAVPTDQWVLVDLILQNNPSTKSLSAVFPTVQKISSPQQRQRLTEHFLKAGVTGDAVNNALYNALSVKMEQRSYDLIRTLVTGGADPNQRSGSLVRKVVLEQDENALKILLQSSCSSETLRNAIGSTSGPNGAVVPLKYIRSLLEAGAKGNIISEMLNNAIKRKDTELLLLFLELGKPDVNYHGGSCVHSAIAFPRQSYLELIIHRCKLNDQTINSSLICILQLPRSDFDRKEKLLLLLPLIRDTGCLSQGLRLELDSLDYAQEDDPDILSSLVSRGASVNLGQHPLLFKAIDMKAFRCLQLIVESKPRQVDMDNAFLECNDRRILELLLAGGISSSVKGRILIHAVSMPTRELDWINSLLVSEAPLDLDDGEALVSVARNGDVDLLRLCLSFISKRSSTSILDAAFNAAGIDCPIPARSKIYHLLLEAGVADESVSLALVRATEQGESGLELSKILVKYKASVDYDGGKAIREAISQGNIPLLSLLLNKHPSIKTLASAFSAAMGIRSPEMQEEIYQLLLSAGFQGTQVDVALVNAARKGASGLNVGKLLLSFGASVNYENGAAIRAAIDIAMQSTAPFCGQFLTALLEQTPRQETLLVALSTALSADHAIRRHITSLCLAKSKGMIPGIDDLLFILVSGVF